MDTFKCVRRCGTGFVYAALLILGFCFPGVSRAADIHLRYTGSYIPVTNGPTPWSNYTAPVCTPIIFAVQPNQFVALSISNQGATAHSLILTTYTTTSQAADYTNNTNRWVSSSYSVQNGLSPLTGSVFNGSAVFVGANSNVQILSPILNGQQFAICMGSASNSSDLMVVDATVIYGSTPGGSDTGLQHYNNLTTFSAQTVFAVSGPTRLKYISFNTNATGTVSVFDTTQGTCTGTPAIGNIAKVTLTATDAPFTMTYDVSVLNGICVVTSVSGLDFTISYK